MKPQPLFDRVLIQQDAAPDQVGAFVIPEMARQKPLTGTVVAVGPGKNGVAMKLNPGDRVMFPDYTGSEIQTPNGSFIIMPEGDVLALLVPDASDVLYLPESFRA